MSDQVKPSRPRPDQGELLSLTSENDFLRKTIEELSVKLGKMETENARLRQTIRDAMQRIEAVRSQIEGRTHGIDEAAEILGGASLLNDELSERRAKDYEKQK